MGLATMGWCRGEDGVSHEIFCSTVPPSGIATGAALADEASEPETVPGLPGFPTWLPEGTEGCWGLPAARPQLTGFPQWVQEIPEVESGRSDTGRQEGYPGEAEDSVSQYVEGQEGTLTQLAEFLEPEDL